MPTVWRSPTFSTFSSTSDTESSNATTIGLGMISGRAILALGEAVISTTRRIVWRREPSVFIHKSMKSWSRTSFVSVSDYADTVSTSSTVPGPGEISGRAIKALGKFTLRGLDEIQLRLRLSSLDRLFPHGNRVLWEGDDGEQMYEEIIDLARPGVYSTRVYKHAMHLLLIQIGFREVKQLIRSFVDWDVERIGDLLARLMDVVLKVDKNPMTQNSLAQAYIRYQDAPHMDPLVPFASFLLQLSSASVAAYEASTKAGSRLLSEIGDSEDVSLTRHLLQILESMQKPISPLHRDIFAPIVGSPKRAIAPELSPNEMPSHISQWKFSWILSHIARGDRYWGILSEAFTRETLDRQKEILFRIVASVIPSEFVEPYRSFPRDMLQRPTDKHLAEGFHLACRTGIKSEDPVHGKDPVNITLRFVLRIMNAKAGPQITFIEPTYFIRIIQSCVPSLIEMSIPEAVQIINEQGIEWYTSAGSTEIVERICLCWEIFNIMPKGKGGMLEDEDE